MRYEENKGGLETLEGRSNFRGSGHNAALFIKDTEPCDRSMRKSIMKDYPICPPKCHFLHRSTPKIPYTALAA
jgi:hypothetical protein